MASTNWTDSFRDLLSREIDLKHVMRGHGIFSIIIGALLVLLPHSVYRNTMYNHIAHEYLRLYGALNFALGWLVWRVDRVGLTDGRVKRVICETFAICYLVQFLILVRAQYAVPVGHSPFHMFVATIFAAIGCLYGYMRYVKKIKSFELPMDSRDN
jgi:hypothetical protein